MLVHSLGGEVATTSFLQFSNHRRDCGDERRGGDQIKSPSRGRESGVAAFVVIGKEGGERGEGNQFARCRLLKTETA